MDNVELSIHPTWIVLDRGRELENKQTKPSLVSNLQLSWCEAAAKHHETQKNILLVIESLRFLTIVLQTRQVEEKLCWMQLGEKLVLLLSEGPSVGQTGQTQVFPIITLNGASE